jgi:signal transduction histidine kinase/CheY-like chemotaxis protein
MNKKNFTDKLRKYSINSKLVGLFIFFSLCIVLMMENAVKASVDHPLNIIYISSYAKDLPNQIKIEDGLNNILNYRSGYHNVYYEYLDGARLPSADVESGLTNFIITKYASIHFDVVVGHGWPAAAFVAKHQAVFGAARRIYAEISTTDLERLQKADVSAEVILAQTDYLTSIQEALTVSGADQIIVAGETKSPSGQIRISAFREAIKKIQIPTHIEYFLDIDLDELLYKVSILPAKTIIYYLLIFNDGHGHSLAPYSVAEKLSERASAPIFSQWESLIGSGIVGGYVLSSEKVGESIGNIIINKNTYFESNFDHVYDWRQITRWNLSQNMLPVNSIIRYRQVTLFEQYRIQILFIISFIILMVIILLLLARTVVQRNVAVRMLAEDRLLLADRVQERTAELAQESQRLLEAKKVAEAANHAKSAFLAMMSHEIRTPMTGIIGISEILKRSFIDVEQKKYIDIMYTSAIGLLTILNDILDYSKIEADKLTLEYSIFDVIDVVKATISLFSPRAEESLNLLKFNTHDIDRLLVRGDAIRIRQILSNLIGNAVKFTRNGSIEITLTYNTIDQRQLLRFEVEDSGIGISDEDLSRLFKPFSQVDIEATRKFGGTGLGLAISKRLVELMGGEIGAMSRPGYGSRFYFTCFVESVDYEVPHAEPEKISFGQSMIILLAEDNPINRMIVKKGLEHRGHQVVVVENGAQAYQAAAARQYDVILMDMQMPVMDGVEATRLIRALPSPFSDVPIVALTADALTEHRMAYMTAGLTDFLTKPIEWDNVDAVLAHLNPENKKNSDININNKQYVKGFDLPLIDHVRFSEIREIMPKDNFNQLIMDFIASSKKESYRLKEVSDNDNLSMIHNLAHSLKGVFSNFGGYLVANKAQELLLCDNLCRSKILSDELIILINKTILEMEMIIK